MVGWSCRTRGPSGGLTAAAARGAAHRADALYVVNDALGSFLLRANEVIDQVPMSACVQKSPKSNKPKSLAKVNLRTTLSLGRFSTHLMSRNPARLRKVGFPCNTQGTLDARSESPKEVRRSPWCSNLRIQMAGAIQCLQLPAS